MKIIFTLIIIAMIITSCQSNKDDSNTPTTSKRLPLQQEGLVVSQQDLYPEGITYSKKLDTIFVSSMKYGKIGSVSSDGVYQDFIVDDEILISVSGIYADDTRNRLIVCNVDPGAGIRTTSDTQLQLAGIAIYDLSTKNRIAYFQLQELYDGNHFTNEITLDPQGNIYVTDSFSPVIYKISADLQQSEILVEDERFMQGEGFNLNGLEYVADNILIVGKDNTGDLFKVDINSNEVTHITLPEGEKINGTDGLIIDGTLGITPSNAQNAIKLLQFNSDYTVVEKIITIDNSNMGQQYEVAGKVFAYNQKNAFNFPTTATRGSQGMYYILNASLGKLFQGDSQETFDIGKLIMQ